MCCTRDRDTGQVLRCQRDGKYSVEHPLNQDSGSRWQTEDEQHQSAWSAPSCWQKLQPIERANTRKARSLSPHREVMSTSFCSDTSQTCRGPGASPHPRCSSPEHMPLVTQKAKGSLTLRGLRFALPNPAWQPVTLVKLHMCKQHSCAPAF